jgi:thioredoxin 1
VKKLLMFGLTVVVLFGALFFVVQYQKSQNKNYYGNQITPDNLQAALNEGEEKTIYFYSPECVHCQEATPIVVPLAEDLGVNLEKVNVLEYPEAWDQYQIEGTPTIKHYVNGEEVAKIEGAKSESQFKEFFETKVLK